MFKTSGKVTEILTIQKGTSAKGEWEKGGFVITTTGKYSKEIAFDVFSKTLVSISSMKVGDDVTVNFDVKSRLYEGRWYSNINAYNIEFDDVPSDIQKEVSEPDSSDTGGSPVPPSDDLPF